MKKLKMLTSILLAIVLCLSFVLPTTVNAADGSIGKDEKKCSITISNQVTGHKFVAYRIFAADLNVVDGVKTLSNVEFADEKLADDMLASINLEFGRDDSNPEMPSFKTAAEVADYLSGLVGDEARQEAAVKFAKAVNEYKSTSYDLTEQPDGENVKYSVSGIEPGYYLIIDENQTTLEPEGSIYSRFILEVAGDVEATAKVEGKPTLDKVVGKKDAEGNADYTPEANMDEKHNTANVGDSVPFKIEINFPNLAEYSSYKFEVTDTLSEGLTFDNNVTMKILGVTTGEGETAVTEDMVLEKNTDFTVVESTEKPGEVTINFNTILDKYEKNKTLVGKTIVIEYSATLNDNAKGNQEANTNTAKLTYSNDPRVDTSYGTTPEVTTETYTYKVTINKVDVKNKDAAWGNSQEPVGSHVKTEGVLSDVVFTLHRVTSPADAEKETSEKIGETYTTNANGQIALPGLANGTYYLIETEAHAGYNKVLGKIYFTISAKYDAENKNVVVNNAELKAEAPSDAKNEASIGVIPEFYADNSDVKFSNANELYLLITNSTGAQLPSTGGVGTVIFTVVGILVMAAVVVIAVKSNKK